jgi:hypothetical protein
MLRAPPATAAGRAEAAEPTGLEHSQPDFVSNRERPSLGPSDQAAAGTSERPSLGPSDQTASSNSCEITVFQRAFKFSMQDWFTNQTKSENNSEQLTTFISTDYYIMFRYKRPQPCAKFYHAILSLHSSSHG